jgi:hypothetical protein
MKALVLLFVLSLGLSSQAQEITSFEDPSCKIPEAKDPSLCTEEKNQLIDDLKNKMADKYCESEINKKFSKEEIDKMKEECFQNIKHAKTRKSKRIQERLKQSNFSIKGKSEEEIKQEVMKVITEQLNVSKKEFEEEENVKGNKKSLGQEIIISSNDGKGINCSIKISDVKPLEKVFTPDENRKPEEVNLLSLFSDDCAYFTTNEFNKEKALGLFNKSSSNEKDYCNTQPSNDPTAHNTLQKVADRICQTLSEGKNPKIPILSTRNLYRDKTPDLAKKRGLFIAKYISQLMEEKGKECDEAGEESSSEENNNLRKREDYEKFFVINEAGDDYDPNKPGDFGIDPYLTDKQKIEEEKQKFEAYHAGRKAKIEDESGKINSAIMTTQNSVKEKTREFETKLQEYNQVKNDLVTKNKNIDEIKTIVDEKFNVLENLRLDIKNLKQHEFELKEMKNIFQKKLNISEEELKSKNELVNAFYNDPVKDKKIWDEKLFNQFKKVELRLVPELEFIEKHDSFSADVEKIINLSLDIKYKYCTLYDNEHKGKWSKNRAKMKTGGSSKGSGDKINCPKF